MHAIESTDGVDSDAAGDRDAGSDAVRILRHLFDTVRRRSGRRLAHLLAYQDRIFAIADVFVKVDVIVRFASTRQRFEQSAAAVAAMVVDAAAAEV